MHQRALSRRGHAFGGSPSWESAQEQFRNRKSSIYTPDGIAPARTARRACDPSVFGGHVDNRRLSPR
jgi:hypothetical protein